MNNTEQVWLDGALLGGEQAAVQAVSPGVTVAMGVFETMAAYDGKVFAFTHHYARLLDGAKRVGLEVPELAVLNAAMDEVLVVNGYTAGQVRVRITLLAGLKNRTSCLVNASLVPAREGFAKVQTVEFRRNEFSPLTGVKATAYAENMLALKEAQRSGADEAIFANTQGVLCEGATSNVFLVHDNCVATPALSSGCLPGVTRKLVIDLCKQQGIPVFERELAMEDLLQAKEAFLTSSLREIHPIVQVNGRNLAIVAGQVTTQLQREFQKLKVKGA